MGIRSSLKGLIKGALGMGDKSSSSTTSSRAPAPRPPEASPPEPEGDSGASMANIECGGQELYERISAGENIIVVDVRGKAELASGVIPKAVHIELGQLPARWEELKDADEIVCYCAAGMRSYNAAMFLREKGLFNATSLEGGIGSWTQAGGPLDTPT
jgi:rhodanese-related sulfurtransferase